MDGKRYCLKSSPALTVPADAADKLLELGDGECALLYLYILRSRGELLPAQAARDLDRSEDVIRAAAERLQRQGLLADAGTRFLPGPEELPQYETADIVRRSREDGAFKALVEETQSILGHGLSGADLNTLFGIYDRLGLGYEVTLLLIHHCVDKLRRRCGEGRLPTMHSIEREAYVWANKELVTPEQAEEYLRSLERLAEEGEKLRRALQIIGREPTRTEREYMDKWLAMGYGVDALTLAYDRTVTSTGKLAWAYMNKIVLSWYEKGLFTVEEIQKGDQRAGGRKSTSRPASVTGYSGNDDLDWLETNTKGR